MSSISRKAAPSRDDGTIAAHSIRTRRVADGMVEILAEVSAGGRVVTSDGVHRPRREQRLSRPERRAVIAFALRQRVLMLLLFMLGVGVVNFFKLIRIQESSV